MATAMASQSYGLQVKVVEARNLLSADSNGLSDPYCVMSLGQARAKTRVIKKNLNPRWNQTFRLYDSGAVALVLVARHAVFFCRVDDGGGGGESSELGFATEFRLTVWDKDTLTADDFLGQLSIDLRDLPIDGQNMWVQLRPRKAGEGVKGEICLQFSVVKGKERAIGEGDHPLMQVEGGAPGEEVEVADMNSPGSVGDAVTPHAAAVAKRGGRVAGSAMDEIKKRLIELKTNDSRDLDLSSCELKGIPKVILDLNFLLHLNLGFNELTDFPSVEALNQLESLDLSGNQITQITQSIIALTALKELLITGNKLTWLPKELGLLTQLTKLDLGNNQVVAFIPEIGNMKHLEELYLQGNPIGTVPPTVGLLWNMEVMDLSACNLVVLPEEFTFQTKLIELNVASNQLRQLPVSFGRLTRLASLNVCDNQLQDLPMSIGYCGGMTSCQIEGNPIKSQEMLRKYKIGSDHLVDFLEKRLIAYKVKTGMDLDTLLFGVADTEPKAPTVDEVEEAPTMTPEERFAALRNEAKGIVQEILLHLSDIRRDMMKAETLPQALRYAQIMRRIKPDVDQIRRSIPPIQMPAPPIFHTGEDKLIALQKTVNGAIKESEVILIGLQKIVAGCTTANQILPYVKLIKPVKAGLAL